MLRKLLTVPAVLWLGIATVSGQESKTSGSDKSEQLGEVTVVASKTVKSADGYVTTLRGTDIVKGKPIVDALKYLPLVNVDVDDNITINGLGVSEIWLDGIKITDRSELKNLPADMIDKVKVTYLSGADKNTTAMGGIIKITLVPISGYSGTIGASANARSHIGSTNQNVYGVIRGRYGKWSFYNYTQGYRYDGKDPMTHRIVSPDNTSFIKLDDKSRTSAFSERVSVGYDFNKRTSLKGNYVLSTSEGRPSSKTVNGDAISKLNQRNQSTVNEGTLVFKSELNDNGTTIYLLGDYYGRVYRQNRDFVTLPGEPTHDYYKNTSGMWNIYGSIQIPLNDEHNLTAATDTYIISEHYRPSSDNNGKYATDDVAANNGGVMPQVSLTAKGRFGKLQYSAGVNWKQNRIKYEPLNGAGKVRNTQSAFSPTIQLRLPFANGRHALSMNYKKTLGDIPYSALTPVVKWEDPYNYTVGNPDLTAKTSHRVGLMANLFGGLLDLSASYAYSKNIIMWETFTDPDNSDIHYSTPINSGNDRDCFFDAGLNIKPLRQWRLKLMAGLRVSPEDTWVSGNYYGNTRLKQFYKIDNSFTFSHGWGGELTLFYEPTFRSYNDTYRYVYQAYGNVYKLFLKNTLQVVFDFWPLDRRRIMNTRVGDQVITRKYAIRNTSVGLTVRWWFNGGRNVNTNFANGTQGYEEITNTGN